MKPSVGICLALMAAVLVVFLSTLERSVPTKQRQLNLQRRVQEAASPARNDDDVIKDDDIVKKDEEDVVREDDNIVKEDDDIVKKDEEDEDNAPPTTTTPVPTVSPPTDTPTRRPTTVIIAGGILDRPRPSSFYATSPRTSPPTELPTLFPNRPPTVQPVATTAAPTIATAVPTQTPSLRATTIAPTETPQENPTEPPTIIVDVATLTPTNSPVDLGTPTSNNLEFLIDVQDIVTTEGFSANFSLWSPDDMYILSGSTNKNDNDNDDTTIKDDDDLESKMAMVQIGVLTSIRALHCVDRFSTVCTVKNDWLLGYDGADSLDESVTRDTHTVGGVAEGEEKTHAGLTLLLPKIGKVTTVGTEPAKWTSWSVSFQIMQLGIPYIEKVVEELNEPYMTAHTVNQLASQMLQDKIVSDIDTSIRNGTFDTVLRIEFKEQGIVIVSSLTGDEKQVFPFSLRPSTPPLEETPAGSAAAPTTTLGPDSNMTEEVAQQNTGSSTSSMELYIAIAAVVAALAFLALAVFLYLRRQKLLKHEPKPKDVTGILDNENDSDIKSKKTPADNSKSSAFPSAVTVSTPPKLQKDVSGSSTEEDAEEEQTGSDYEDLASWQQRPRRFVLQSDSQVLSHSEHQDDGTADFPTGGGSLVAGSIVVGSMMNESVESSLEGWSVTSAELTWS